MIAFLQGDEGRDVDVVDDGLGSKQVILPPVVVTELLSDPKLPHRVRDLILDLPVLDLLEGYWVRAGETREKLVSRKLKALLADTLIAQSCIDRDTPLVTRDRDFRHFAKHSALKLVE